MSTYTADPQAIRRLADELETRAEGLGSDANAASDILVGETYTTSSGSVASGIATVTTWVAGWVKSLRERATILERTANVPMSQQEAEGLAVPWSAEGSWALTASWLSFAEWNVDRMATKPAKSAPVVEGSGSIRDGFASAAQAMLEGAAPNDIAVDERYFPAEYVDAHTMYRRLVAERKAAADRAWSLWEEVTTIQLGGSWTEADIRSRVDEFHELQDRVGALDKQIDELQGRLAADVNTVAAYLSGLSLLRLVDRQVLVGEFLAARITADIGDADALVEVGKLVDIHLDTTEGAVAFVNALPDWAFQGLPAAAGVSSFHHAAKAEFMEPFARTMAMASHSDDLAIDIARTMDDPDSGHWFLAGRVYATDFLIAAAAGAIAAGEPWYTWSFESVYRRGEELPLDPRVLILDELARRGSPATTALIDMLSDRELLHTFLDPRTVYADDGYAAAATLALLGTGFDVSSAILIAEIMQAIAGVDPADAIVQGASLMMLPHLGSLTAPPHQDTIPGTPLRDVLDTYAEADRELIIERFLGAVMDDAVAANHMFSGLAITIAETLTLNFDPDDPTLGNHAVWELRTLTGLVGSIYLQIELEQARRADASNALWQSLLATGIDLILALGIAAIAPTSLAVALVLEVAAAAGNNIGLPLLTDFGLSTTHAEEVLESGYRIQDGLVDGAMLAVAVLLADAGLIKFPDTWFVGGELVRPQTAVFLDYLDQLEQSGFPVWDWFLPPSGVVGAMETSDGS